MRSNVQNNVNTCASCAAMYCKAREPVRDTIDYIDSVPSAP